MKKLKRIEPAKEESKKLKIAAYYRLVQNLKASKAALLYKHLIITRSCKVILSGNMQEFALIMEED